MILPRTPSFRLDGKRALVAGASSGIGLGSAVALAEAGAAVTLAARSGGKLREIARAMVAEGWDEDALQMDVANVAATAHAVAEHGPFDIHGEFGGAGPPRPGVGHVRDRFRRGGRPERQGRPIS
jgi:NAD(P)-dependent dehydrogenase (short-subunit alcohol dehydrogenase family)